MTLHLKIYDEADESLWDALCETSINATFLHSRRFLGYHGSRFDDRSVLIYDKDEIVGLFPAAPDPADKARLISHPGITYGGVVHNGRLTGDRMQEALQTLCRHYGTLGFGSLRYKALPHIYMSVPAQDDLYGLFSLGAVRSRCDLACAIDLARRLAPNERRRRGLRRGLRSITLSQGPDLLDQLWDVIETNLADRHAARPVHSRAEMAELIRRFPQAIEICCGLSEDRIVAGTLIFKTSRVWHAQYIGASDAGYASSALDVIFDNLIERARQAGARYFDFGTSNEQQGTVLNAGLYRFKAEFGGGGVAHEFFDLPLGSGFG